MIFLAQSGQGIGLGEIVIGLIVIASWIWSMFNSKKEEEQHQGGGSSEEEEERVRRIREEIQRRRAEREGGSSAQPRPVQENDTVHEMMRRMGIPTEDARSVVVIDHEEESRQQQPRQPESRRQQQAPRFDQQPAKSAVERRLEEQKKRVRESQEALRKAGEQAGEIGRISDTLVGKPFDYTPGQRRRRSGSSAINMARHAIDDPAGARKALIYAEILGPPVALRDDKNALGPIGELK